jgi:hypothetical protein
MDPLEKTPEPSDPAEAIRAAPETGLTRGSLLARAGAVAAGGALLASPLGLGSPARRRRAP